MKYSLGARQSGAQCNSRGVQVAYSGGVDVSSSQEMYAASKESFYERIKEELDIEIIQAPLTRDNYKKKFHNMICWEEKKHIEILDKKYDNTFPLFKSILQIYKYHNSLLLCVKKFA